MNRSNTTLTILLCLAVTLVVLLLDYVGVFAPWERATIDLRFVASPRPKRPMTDEIVHVDIDDGALDMIGRWPWGRATLADVVDELGLAGSKTIAIDLVMSDPQPPEHLPGLEEPIDHDARLAAALGRGRCVLPVKIFEGPLFHAVWRNSTGRAELDRLLEVLGRDVQKSAEEAAVEAGLTGERTTRLLRRPLEFKRVAAWRKLRSGTEADTPASFGEFEQLMTPDRGEYIGSYPERPILQSVWRQHRAWRTAEALLQLADFDGTFRDTAPLPAFASQAGAVGFVNAEEQKHADGVLRELNVLMPSPGGRSLQFGLAAAMLHRDLQPSDLSVDGDLLRIGDFTLPLNHGRLWIAWPTSDADPRWEGLLAGRKDDSGVAGHMSIRVLVELARARRTQNLNRERLADTTRMILDYAQVECEPGRELTEESRLAALDEIQFTLEEAPEAGEEEEDAAWLDHVHNCRMWLGISQVFEEGQETIHLVESNLRNRVEDRLVLVGWTATSASADFVSTAIDARTPGVVVHAAMAHMALTGDCVWFMPRWSGLLITLLLGLICGIAAARFSTFPATVAAGASLIGYVGVGGGWLFAAHDLLMPLAAPVSAGGLSWIACTAWQAAVSQRERRRITRQFKARVSSQLVDHLIGEPESLSITGAEREMTIFFGDLEGFTSISESLGGPATVSTLNRYMSELTTVLIGRGAYLNKFLGDGLMAFWSAFSVDTDQAGNACLAAVECQNAVERLNNDSRFEHIPRLGLRLGIATGRVVVGDCGAPPELNDYTVIGNAANLASRLESANRVFGTKILIDGRTRELLTDDAVLLGPIGRVLVVGQTVPVNVFEVAASGSDLSEEQITLTENAVAAFGACDLAKAASAFDALEARFGSSALIDLYREAIAEAGDGFDGVLRMRTK